MPSLLSDLPPDSTVAYELRKKSGAEIAARLTGFVEERGAKVTPPSALLVAISQGAASGIAAATDVDPAAAVQWL